jgi:hypothetical protein
VHLQCTGLSWNAAGNSIAASYGKTDVDGWCDFPGAVCCWSVFSKTLVPENPDFVLDHPSCLMCVQYHPINPSIIAAGSFNGEIIVWDLTNPESPLAVSAITEYSHKQPISSLSWVHAKLSGQDGTSSSSSSSSDGANDINSWLLSSVCTGGKALFWSLKNQLAFPVKGVTLAKGKSSRRYLLLYLLLYFSALMIAFLLILCVLGGCCREYPASHGATSVSFAGSSSGGGGAAAAALARPKWMLVGQEGGAIVRANINAVLGGTALTKVPHVHCCCDWASQSTST